MFVLKNSCYLKNTVFTSKGVLSVENLIPQCFFSTVVQPSNETVNSNTNLDKLYKKLEVEVRGNDPAVLKSYGIFSTTAASHLGITVGRNTTPKKHSLERFTVLKSAFVHKKHRVQYEIRTYYRHLDFLKLTGSTADTLLEYLQRNLPEGVAMKVTKHEISILPEAINNPPQANIIE